MFGLNRRRRRLETVIGRVAGERMARGEKGNEAERRKAIQQKLKEVEQKRSGQRKFRLADGLAHAGLVMKPAQFILASIGLGAVAGVAAFAAVSPLMGVLAAVFFGLAVPRFVLKVKAARRLKRFTLLFADAIDVIVRGVRSGLPFGECIKIIGREVPEPVGAEFRLVTESVRLGVTVEDSLTRMSVRVPTPEVRFFCIVVSIQQQTGGNLADTLSKLSEVLRSRHRMRDKIQAMSSEAKASAGIIGSLPVVLAALLGLIAPDYIGLLFTTDTGNYLLAGGGFWMGIGVVVMRGMINFDI